MRQTSLEAFYSMDERYLTGRRLEVFRVIKMQPNGVTDKQVASILNWPINRIVPRRHELEQHGFVHEVGIVYDGKYPNTLFAVTPQADRVEA